MMYDYEEITLEDVSSHIYELYVDSSNERNAQDLGILSRKSSISLTIDNTDYEFEQSISNLNTSKSSTGFVLWRISVAFVEWILNSALYDFKGKYMVEVGAGVTGLFSVLLGGKVSHFISTDQYHLLKLLKKNIRNNIKEFESSTIEGSSKPRKNKPLPRIDCCVYDWENIEQGQHELTQLNSDKPDFIIGCDIVYNDYLVPYLVDAIEAISGPQTITIIGLQLRLPENIELFVETLLKRGFQVWKHEESALTPELKYGFVIYYITKSKRDQ